ncbi:MAG: CopD family protein [Candidatus Pseudobacter hemicellulosilyticus]|uniref:Protoporphyrinogen IX oxidase n=1 Tax=Candidatus Pseudobacter hemicellulosilyticus TaxID=3121375 RepID=A0AAJ5WXI5_9BACT|nr:MAG: CopD family protein [Pseudobacter sp.]
MYSYIKALHIIFIVTWFAGLFYIPRLLMYNTEAAEEAEPGRTVLRKHFNIMMKRLWYGITWPSAVLTAIFGVITWYMYLRFSLPGWLLIKLLFVVGLYVYHFSLQSMVKQQLQGVFKYTSQQLRLWNEVATIFLVAIVMLVVVKDGLSAIWGLVGLLLFIILLLLAIRVYKLIRQRKK